MEDSLKSDRVAVRAPAVCASGCDARTTLAPRERNSRVSLRSRSRLEIEQRGNDRGAAHQGNERNREAPAIASHESPDQAAEHHSPRKIGAGSKCAARRRGIKLPKTATAAAIPTITGRRINRGVAGLPKTLAPNDQARPVPTA